jgi:hypothetical protein
LIILIILGKEYKSRSSWLCNFLYSAVTSSLFGPNILLSTLFSNTLSLWSSLTIRDQVTYFTLLYFTWHESCRNPSQITHMLFIAKMWWVKEL